MPTAALAAPAALGLAGALALALAGKKAKTSTNKLAIDLSKLLEKPTAQLVPVSENDKQVKSVIEGGGFELEEKLPPATGINDVFDKLSKGLISTDEAQKLIDELMSKDKPKSNTPTAKPKEPVEDPDKNKTTDPSLWRPKK